METLIELVSVTAGYDTSIVLKDIDFVIRDDDFIGIIGPNGGGKTTLLKVIIGLIEPFRGSVKRLYQDDGQRFIGYLPQTSQTDKRFPITVQDVVLSGLMKNGRLIKRYTSEERELASLYMNKTGVYSLKSKNIGNLSGGQLQRVFLSRALVSSPRLLILDEPNTFVDGNFESELYNILNELRNKMAIVMVSHDIGMVSSYVKSIACVNRCLHYHYSNIITDEMLAVYNCPIDLITHGDLPHRVLSKHEHPHGSTH